MNSFSQGVTAIVDLQREVGADIRSMISAAVSATEGVKQVAFSPYAPRMLLVQYDSHAVSAGEIRNTVQNFLKVPGPIARLVGM